MYLCDFHIHTNFSDGKLSIPEIVDLYGLHGFGAIAITDHLCENKTIVGKAAGILNRTLTESTYPLYLEILKSEADRAWKKYRMIVIPGVEFTKNTALNARSAHILGLGLRQMINPNLSPFELCIAIRSKAAISVAAHPVHTGIREKQTYQLWSQREELRDVMDAWEVASGKVIFNEVLTSGLPMLANSDLHRPNQIHSWKTVLECEKNEEAILEAIKKQNLEFKYYEGVLSHADHSPALGFLRLAGIFEYDDIRDLESLETL